MDFTLILHKMWLAGRDNTFVIVKRKLLKMGTYSEGELYQFPLSVTLNNNVLFLFFFLLFQT